MKNEKSEKNMSMIEKIYQSSMIAMPRVVLTFGAGHPFDLVKTRMQANPNIISAVTLSKDIYTKTGIKGFYTGGALNFSRTLVKETIRSPLRGILTKTYNEFLPSASSSSKATATALSMAIADTIIICPLERIKVWIMTNYTQNKSITSFFTQRNNSNLSWQQDLFKGLTVSLARSSMAWCSYLVPECLIREKIIKISPHIDKANPQLSLADNLLIGSLSGIINCLSTLPLDTIKTKVQSKDYSDSVSIKKLIAIGKECVEIHGVRGLYPGFTVRLIHYGIVGALTADVIQKVDQVWQNK